MLLHSFTHIIICLSAAYSSKWLWSLSKCGSVLWITEIWRLLFQSQSSLLLCHLYSRKIWTTWSMPLLIVSTSEISQLLRECSALHIDSAKAPRILIFSKSLNSLGKLSCLTLTVGRNLTQNFYLRAYLFCVSL